MPKIDFGEVRRGVTLAQVLDLVGYHDLRRVGKRWRGPCPSQCCTSLRCCSFVLSSNLWYCHVCKTGGRQIDLFARYHGVSLFAAAEELCRLLGRPVPFLP